MYFHFQNAIKLKNFISKMLPYEIYLSCSQGRLILHNDLRLDLLESICKHVHFMKKFCIILWIYTVYIKSVITSFSKIQLQRLLHKFWKNSIKSKDIWLVYWTLWWKISICLYLSFFCLTKHKRKRWLLHMSKKSQKGWKTATINKQKKLSRWWSKKFRPIFGFWTGKNLVFEQGRVFKYRPIPAVTWDVSFYGLIRKTYSNPYWRWDDLI